MKWPTGALDSVAILDRQSIHPSEAEAATPYLGLEHLDGDGGINCVQTVGSAGLKSNKFQFSDRHVLFGKLRPYLRKIARPKFSGVCSTDIIPILPKDEVSRDFLFYFLRTPDTVTLATNRSSGANLPRLSPKQLASFRVPLPPLAEQQRIARILDAADALRAKRREALAQLDTLLQSAFLDMFGDPVKSGWTMVTVEAVASRQIGAIRTGPFGSQLLHSEFVDEGIRVLGIDNAVANEFWEGEPRFITAQKYERLRRYTVRPRDVLITIMGTCGRCAVVPDDIGTAINTKHLCCITLDRGKCLPEFMHAYFLKHPIARRYLERNAKGAIMSGLNMGIIKALPIPAAPLDLQHRFAAIVQSVERQRTRQRAHLAELDTLFASLQSRAFRGDL